MYVILLSLIAALPSGVTLCSWGHGCSRASAKSKGFDYVAAKSERYTNRKDNAPEDTMRPSYVNSTATTKGIDYVERYTHSHAKTNQKNVPFPGLLLGRHLGTPQQTSPR